MIYAILFSLLFNDVDPPKLIYVGDPMCSWCYGISPELDKVASHYKGKLEIEIVMGGLRPYNTETMFDLKDFLADHWQEVNHRSGQPFSYGILENQKITYDTEPPSRAVVTVRQLTPHKTLAFFTAIQKDFYFKNKNMHLVESYYSSLDELGIDRDKFYTLFMSDEMKTLVKKDFERANSLKVHSFPTLLLVKNDRTYFVANGYSTVDKMIERIDKYLN